MRLVWQFGALGVKWSKRVDFQMKYVNLRDLGDGSDCNSSCRSKEDGLNRHILGLTRI